jgi:hypothetical protein
MDAQFGFYPKIIDFGILQVGFDPVRITLHGINQSKEPLSIVDI